MRVLTNITQSSVVTYLFRDLCGKSVLGPGHRHRIDKYLDTLLANQPISDGEAIDHCQKGAPQDGRLPDLTVARSCLTNHSEAASEITNDVIDVSSAVT